jgi:hypothetical protein
MKMPTFAALAGAALVTTATATAAEAGSTVTFTAIDSFEAIESIYSATGVSGTGGKVVGVLEGQPTPQTYGFFFTSSEQSIQQVSRCERLILMAINRPGRYSLVLASKHPDIPGLDGIVYLERPTCKLVRH